MRLAKRATKKVVKVVKVTKKAVKVQTKSLKAKAWKLMSEWVRRKNADWRGYVRCYTCPKIDVWNSGNIHAGHFKHGVLDYTELNIHPQCNSCNTYYSGRLDVYATRLAREHGLHILDELQERADAERKRIHELGYAYTTDELKEIIIDLKEKIKCLKTS